MGRSMLPAEHFQAHGIRAFEKPGPVRYQNPWLATLNSGALSGSDIRTIAGNTQSVVCVCVLQLFVLSHLTPLESA